MQIDFVVFLYFKFPFSAKTGELVEIDELLLSSNFVEIQNLSTRRGLHKRNRLINWRKLNVHKVWGGGLKNLNLILLLWFLFIDSLREKCPSMEFFLVRISPYSDRIRENTDQKKSVFGHFSHSVNTAVNKTSYFFFATKI